MGGSWSLLLNGHMLLHRSEPPVKATSKGLVDQDRWRHIYSPNDTNRSTGPVGLVQAARGQRPIKTNCRANRPLPVHPLKPLSTTTPANQPVGGPRLAALRWVFTRVPSAIIDAKLPMDNALGCDGVWRKPPGGGVQTI